MKHLDVQSSTYIDCGVGNNEKDSKFEVVDPVRRLKYENILGKCFTPNCYEEIFVIKKVKNIKPWAYVIENLMVKNLFEHLKKNEKDKSNRVWRWKSNQEKKLETTCEIKKL